MRELVADKGKKSASKIIADILQDHGGLASKVSDLAPEYNQPVMDALRTALACEPYERSEHQRRPFQVWTWDDLEAEPDTQWQIGDEAHPVLIEQSLWANFGKYKTGKTYFSMEEGFCIAFGLSFHGLPVKQANICYLIAEGGVKRHQKRFAAVYAKYAKEMAAIGYPDAAAALNAGKFNLITTAVNLADPRAKRGVDELIRELQEQVPDGIGVVFLDTWARMLAAGGTHASDQEGVPMAINGCDRIRSKLKCSVVIVAHIGMSKDAQNRPTGMGDLPGALDGATKSSKEGEGASAWFHYKATIQRHTEDGFEILAQLAKSDADADAVLVSKTGGDYDVAHLTADQKRCLDELRVLGGALVPVKQWREATKLAGVFSQAKGDGAWRSYFSRTKKALIEAGVIDESGDTVSINERNSEEEDGPGGE
jgi:hypothetical protein